MTEPTLPAGSSNPDVPATPAAPSETAGQPPGGPPPASTVELRQPVVPPPVQYKGGDLDPARGPGLGCFYVQLVALVALLVATPLTVNAGWPPVVSMGLLIAIIILLLFTGQTMIFLLRLVAAERGRRRPLAARSRTVGDIEADEAQEAAAAAGHRARTDGAASSEPPAPAAPAEGAGVPPEHGGSVRE